VRLRAARRPRARRRSHVTTRWATSSAGRRRPEERRRRLRRPRQHVGRSRRGRPDDQLPLRQRSLRGRARSPWSRDHARVRRSRQPSRRAQDARCLRHAAVTERTYDAEGRLVTERRRVDATTWATSVYGDYADCGEPGTVTRKGVVLAGGAAPLDLVERRSFDSFGDLVTQTDASVSFSLRLPSTRRATYRSDRPGRHCDPHSLWCSRWCCGNVAEQRCHFDQSRLERIRLQRAGQVATQTVKASDGSTVSVTTHVYDTAGHEVRTDASDVPGQSITTYDSVGNISALWPRAPTPPPRRRRFVWPLMPTEVSLRRSCRARVCRRMSTATPADGSIASERASDGRLTRMYTTKRATWSPRTLRATQVRRRCNTRPT